MVVFVTVLILVFWSSVISIESFWAMIFANVCTWMIVVSLCNSSTVKFALLLNTIGNFEISSYCSSVPLKIQVIPEKPSRHVHLGISDIKVQLPPL